MLSTSLDADRPLNLLDSIGPVHSSQGILTRTTAAPRCVCQTRTVGPLQAGWVHLIGKHPSSIARTSLTATIDVLLEKRTLASLSIHFMCLNAIDTRLICSDMHLRSVWQNPGYVSRRPSFPRLPKPALHISSITDFSAPCHGP